MKPSEQIYRLQSHLDRSLHRVQLWIVGDLQEIGVQVAALETANAELLEALKDVLEILGHIPEDDPHETWGNVNASIQEAHDITDDTIRKAKGE